MQADQPDGLVAAAAFSAAVAIVAGTFAAHVATGKAVEWLQTGEHVQLIHAVAVIALSGVRQRRFPARFMLVGANLFASALYLLAMGAPKWVAAAAPIGGALMVISWLILAFKELRYRTENN